MRTKPKQIDGFGERLKKVLEITGTKQRELSKMMFIGEAIISHYVKGRRIPRKDRIEEICEVLGIDSKYLLTGDEESLEELIDVCEEGDKW